MIVVDSITKRFGGKPAVDDLSFVAEPGRVTGFLGPNGAGKSTTMRCIVGLDRLDGGRATVDQHSYREAPAPIHAAGTLLDAGYAHPRRRGRDHLRFLAQSNGIGNSRVDEVLSLVGLADAGKKRVGAYSLGMRQRLGLAGALLGDPANLILDEPANGLDPEGVRWIRDFLKYLASEGRTVLVSSHLLSEVSLMADDLVVIGRGRLIDQCTPQEFIERHSQASIVLESPQLDRLTPLLTALGARLDANAAATDRANVFGVSARQIGDVAAENGIPIYELTSTHETLEDVFLSVTSAHQEYRTGGNQQ